MTENKTKYTDESVTGFINKIDNEQKRSDSFKLIELMEEVSGHSAKMWGPSIIGFGSYRYKYDSGHEGDAPLIGFSPRKSAFSLYVFTGMEEHKYLLEDLGKYKMGKACIYVKKLSDIDQDVLIKIINANIQFLQGKYPTI